MTQHLPRPLSAILIAMLGLLLMTGAVYALGRSLGYIPGAGLVDNSSGIRMLAEPIAVTRDGVTLTISSVIAYEDRVELDYTVKGVAPENDGWQSEDAAAHPTDFCGGVDVGSAPSKNGDARLKLPDGTVLERDATSKFPQNAFVMKPVYAANVPAGVTQMTFLLDCIPQARRGAVPENWSVPFELKTVPAGTVVGAPVIEVEPTVEQPVKETATPSTLQSSAVPAPVVTMSLSKIVPLETRTIFYFSLDVEDKDPSLISIMPASVYVIDSQGQKIQLIGNFPWQPFEHRMGSEFEYTSQTRPADGPLTLVVENAIAYYAPMYVEPPLATSDEMSFTFNAGANPQYGQTWDLNKVIEIAGYSIKIVSARAASFDDIRYLNFIDGSQGFEYGYDFLVEADPSVKMLVAMDIMSEDPPCWVSNQASHVPESSSLHYVQLCRDTYPKEDVRVTIRELSVLVENTWQTDWKP